MQIHNLRDWQTHLPTLRAWKAEGKSATSASPPPTAASTGNWRRSCATSRSTSSSSATTSRTAPPRSACCRWRPNRGWRFWSTAPSSAASCSARSKGSRCPTGPPSSTAPAGGSSSSSSSSPIRRSPARYPPLPRSATWRQHGGRIRPAARCRDAPENGGLFRFVVTGEVREAASPPHPLRRQGGAEHGGDAAGESLSGLQ